MTLRVERKNPIALFNTSELTKQNRKQPKQQFGEVRNTAGESSRCRGEESVVRYILGLIGRGIIVLYAEEPPAAAAGS